MCNLVENIESSRDSNGPFCAKLVNAFRRPQRQHCSANRRSPVAASGRVNSMIFKTDQPPFLSVALVPKAVIDEISCHSPQW